MNFFDSDCREPPLNHTLFGLCDDQNGQKAYSSVNNPDSWIATVKNDGAITLVFTAIDKCVIKDNEETGRGRCDCMLTSVNHLYLIELKDERSDWKQDAIEQLESTIRFLIASHDISGFKFKKAFACNKKHPRFKEIDNEMNLRFFRTYGFRIDAQADIVIL